VSREGTAWNPERPFTRLEQTAVQVEVLGPLEDGRLRVRVNGEERVWVFSTHVGEQLARIHREFDLTSGQWDLNVRAVRDHYIIRDGRRLPAVQVCPVPRRGE
jgi:hypothetical protein